MRTGRKTTGGKYIRARKGKLFEKKGQPRIVKLGENRAKFIRGMGGNLKRVSLTSNVVNIMINGKAKKAKIKNVIETPANKFLARQNILIKGAIIDTDLGKARITNRPSQDGQVQAVIIK